MKTDRDRSIDRLLRHSLSTTPGATSNECIDGEALAAWSAGTLPRAEASAIENHIADCARCQSMVAAFARTEPATPLSEPWWRRWQVRWLVPIAAAATIAAVWIAIPQQQRDRAELAQRAAESAAPRAAPPPTVPQPPSERETAPPEAKREAAPPERPGFAAGDRTARRRDVQAETRAEPRPQEVDRLASAERAAPAPTAAAPVTPPAAPAPAAPAPSAPAAAPPVPAAKDTAASRGLARPSGVMEKVAIAVVIASPNGSDRWRVLDDGTRVEHSIDGGLRWEELTLPEPVILTAGHSPAPGVAWLVGRAGSIYLTTDGSRFARVSFPERSDLTGVVAADADRATVTLADGRRLRTTNRGATWTPQ